jgi:predicted  nucleic acid-binding Zn-ribbon protein
MGAHQIFLIVFIAVAVLMLFGAVAMMLAARKSQKVAASLLLLLTRPERAKVQDAARVLQVILAGEMEKIESNFKSMSDILAVQVERAEDLRKELGEHNDKLVGTADEAARKIGVMNQRLENMLGGFTKIVESHEWAELDSAADKFQNRINDLLNKVDSTAQDTIERTRTLQGHIDGWIESGKKMTTQLQTDMENNTSHMNSMVVESDAMREKLEELAKSVAEGFGGVKSGAVDYETVISENDKLLSAQIERLEEFTKQSKQMLSAQINGLTNTANSVGAQIRLAESSIEKQEKKLKDTVVTLSESAQNTEESVKGIVNEVSVLVGKFNTDIKDFAIGVVDELNTVQGVANTTLNDTKLAAGAFANSVRTMAEGVRETLIEMNNAHTQLTGQSAELVRVSSDTTAQLQPLSELIEKYYASLPDLTKGSAELSEQLSGEIASLDEKIRSLNSAMEQSIIGIADSTLKLDHLAGDSRQQMIDLMSDYAKAVDTMKTLTNQMAEARAAAPMKAIGAGVSAGAGNAPRVSAQDFIASAGALIERLHELSVDLTRSVGAEIPNTVWAKYHSGDKTIFSKWFAKMLNAADKRKVKELFKQDAVFRSQATQFIRGFAKMMAGAEQTDNREMITATLLKTDLGQMYMALRAYL